MRKQLGRVILAAGTVAAALGLAIPAAVASGTWTVTGGPNFTATGTVKISDGANSFTCTATASGTVNDESHGTNTAFFTITKFTLTNCKGSFSSTGMGSNK